MPSCIEQLQYHLVWSTKYRYKLIDEKMAKTLREYFLNKQKPWDYLIKSVAIESDHVHLLIQTESSQVDLNKLISKLKGGSSFLLRKKYKFLHSYPSLWTPSHFVASIGNVSSETVKEYLEKQGVEEEEIVNRTFVYKVFRPSKSKIAKLKKYFKACLKGKKNKVPSSIFQDFKRIKRKEGGFGLYLRAQCLRLEKRDNKIAKYWLRVPGSRYEKSFWLPLRGRDLPEGTKVCDSTIRKKKGELYVYIVVQQEKLIKRARKNKIIAIDLGVLHPITSVALCDGKAKDHHFYGKEIKSLIYKRERRAKQLQHSGIKEGLGERLQKYTRRIRELIHLYTKEIVNKEEHFSIVVGNLRGIRNVWVKGKTNKTTRKKANRIPYGQIMNQLFYKGTLLNLSVVFVNEAYTSQRCSRCGVVDSSHRKGQRYVCGNCGYQNQADVNGAINIGSFALANLLSQSHQALRHVSANASL